MTDPMVRIAFLLLSKKRRNYTILLSQIYNYINKVMTRFFIKWLNKQNSNNKKVNKIFSNIICI